MKDTYEGYPFAAHLRDFHTALADIYQSRNPEQINEKVLHQKDALRQARDTYMNVEEFVEHNFSTYKQIHDFAAQHKNNFGSLDDVTIPLADDLVDYLKNDREPWDKFPQMKRAYRQVAEAIKNLSLIHI